ncbi:polysaccharide deacetylase family protein [Priestia taiwanensis]
MIKTWILCICIFTLTPQQGLADEQPTHSKRIVTNPISLHSFQHSGLYNEAEIQSGKIAYLTFDDGPNKYTKQILHILQTKQAKGTFFLVGSNIQKHSQIVQEIVSEGHYIGLHSMTHDAKILYNGNANNLLHEMREVQNLVARTAHVDTNLIRVPYGSMPYLKQHYRDDIVLSNYKLWDWTIDTYDWRDKNRPNTIINRVKQQATKPVEVILMHDLHITVAILPTIIDVLQEKGYKLVTYHPAHHIQVNFWKDHRL